jgi:hypothetical protein
VKIFSLHDKGCTCWRCLSRQMGQEVNGLIRGCGGRTPAVLTCLLDPSNNCAHTGHAA